MTPKPQMKSKAQAYQEIRRRWKQRIQGLHRRISDQDKCIKDTYLRLNTGRIHGQKATDHAYIEIADYKTRKTQVCFEISILQNQLNLFKAEE